MKIGEALAEKKKLQSRLAKCNELVGKSYYYRGEKPDFDYDKLRSEIKTLMANIRDLKMKIQRTNLKVTVAYKEKKMITLAELIIRLGDIRSEIAVMNTLYKSKDDFLSLRYDETENAKPQVPPEKIEEDIKNLNEEKTSLDALLQRTNWTEELIE